MSRSDTQLARFWIRREQELNGQLLLSGAGRAGEAPTDVLWAQQHGFASRPPAGSQAWTQAMAGRPSQLVAFGGERPDLRPKIEAGASVLYDHNGHIAKIFDSGLIVDVKDQTTELRQGNLKIVVAGNDAYVEVDVDKKLYLGGDPAVHNFARVETESGPSLNVYARIP